MADSLPGAVAPVENAPGAQPVSAPAAPTGTEPAAPIEGDGSVKPPKTYSEEEHRKGVSDRLSKERKRIAREVRLELERDHFRTLAEGRTQQPAKDVPGGKAKPLAKDFTNVDDYIDAVTDWKDEQREAKRRKEAEEREPQQRQAQSQAEYARALRAKLSEGSEKHDDFEEMVFGDDVPFTDPMVAAIHESDTPVELAYYLGTHPDELKRIAKLPSTRQVGELLKIEEKLKLPPKQTTAPAPIVPNGGGNAGNKKDYSQMTTEEHVKAYRGRDKRR